MAAGLSAPDQVLLDVFRSQRPSLWGFFVRAAGDESLAEDMLQETFLRAWGRRGALDEVAESEVAARQYLWRIARNLVIDEIRARQRWRRRDGGPLDSAATPAPGPDPEETLEQADALRAVRAAAARLPSQRVRRCVQLWLAGQDLASIAEDLRLDPVRTRGLLQRGKSDVVRRATGRLRLRPAVAGDRP